MAGPTAGEALAAQLNGALPEGGEWDEREAALVDLARRQADDIEALERLLEREGPTVTGAAGQSRLNPVFGELRQQRLALSKILSGLRLPDEGMSGVRDAVKRRRAHNAAKAQQGVA
jgi:hypothetical protein